MYVDYFELDLVGVAAELAATIPGVRSIRLFGSRKYPGKVRSDLDLLITGPSNLSSLLDFRDKFQHYKPLDLWLASGGAATSAVNGSVLPVEALRTIELYPHPDPNLLSELRVQRFSLRLNLVRRLS